MTNEHTPLVFGLPGLDILRPYQFHMLTYNDEDYRILHCDISMDERIEIGQPHWMMTACPEAKTIFTYPEALQLEMDEFYCILYHEIAHCLGYQSEEDADNFAISLVGRDAYDRAVRKTVEIKKQYYDEHNMAFSGRLK